MHKYIFVLFALSFFACKAPHKEKVRIIVDTNREFIKMDADSIYWSRGKWRIDSIKGNLIFRSFIESDTLIGLKNCKPTVIIYDGKDTQRYFYGDTLRFETCQKNNQ